MSLILVKVRHGCSPSKEREFLDNICELEEINIIRMTSSEENTIE